MNLLLDENLSPLHARMSRALGHDAVSVVELGLAGSADPEVRATAIESGRILVTLDVDFANIVRYPPAGTPGGDPTTLAPANRGRNGCCYAMVGSTPFRGQRERQAGRG